jgi:hypothetical protein
VIVEHADRKPAEDLVCSPALPGIMRPESELPSLNMLCYAGRAVLMLHHVIFTVIMLS